MAKVEDGGAKAGGDAKGGAGNAEGKSAGTRTDSAAKLQALSSVLTAFTSAFETVKTVSDNRLARERIASDAAESLREYELRREALRAAIGQTFAERNRTLDEYFRHLDDAMVAGDMEKAHVITSNITDVVKSGPLKGLADLRASMMPGGAGFSIGSRD
jgi:hypothetical protein